MKTDLEAQINAVKSDCEHTQSIMLGTAYATMKAVSGEKKLTSIWMKQIEDCVRSRGKQCNAVKGIGAVHDNEIRKG